MTKFVIDTVDGTWVKFKSEFVAHKGESSQVFYFTMFKYKWELAGRPTELLITVEGLTTQ